MSYVFARLKDASVSVRNNKILQNINCEIKCGKVVAVMGYSGSGKTTLLKLIAELLFAEKGWIISGEINLMPGLKVAWVSQNPALQLFKNFVYDELGDLSSEKNLQLLSAAKLENIFKKRCFDLSQGEKSIVAVLRAINQSAGLLILDEVTVNLSLAKKEWLKQVISAFRQNGGTVLVSDHTPIFIDCADEFILINNGSLSFVTKEEAKDFFVIDEKWHDNFSGEMVVDNKSSLRIEEIEHGNINSSLVRPISFCAKSGEIIGLSGEVGSGKSTLLQIICGIQKGKSGDILWNGKKLKAVRERRDLMTLVTPDSMRMFFARTVGDELKIYNVGCKEKNQKIVALFGLDGMLSKEICALSYGERQKLAIVCSIIAGAKILIFDEPTYGMDKFSFLSLVAAMKMLAAYGHIVIVASHDALLFEKVATKIICL